MEIADANNFKELWAYGGTVFNFLILLVCFSFLIFKRSAEIILLCIGSVLHFLSSLVSLLGYGVLSGNQGHAYFGENEIYFITNVLYTIGTICLYAGIIVLFVLYVRTTRKMELNANA